MSFTRTTSALASRTFAQLAAPMLLLAAGCNTRAPAPLLPNATDSAAAASVRLTVDTASDATVKRCLANEQGVVPRYRDNEAYVSVDPKDRDRIITVWQTMSGAGSVAQWTRSTDGGRTWTTPRAMPINACAGGPIAVAPRTSDPWTTFGPDGRAYVSAIAWKPNPNDGPDLVSALVVVASPDGGTTWEAPVVAAIAPSTAISHDNLAITADPTRPRTVYAATTRAESKGSQGHFGQLGFTRSDDGGKTWTPIRPISAPVDGERIGAPQIVVDPRSGRLYAVYHRSRRGTEAVIGVMTSTDRGDTWSTEAVAAPHVGGLPGRHPVTGRDFVLATDIVQATVSPATGHLVIAYADARRNPGGRRDVSIVWSRDGTRWSRPLVVSDSSAETAWLPAIAAAENGEIGVAYYSANFAPGATAARARVMLQRFSIGVSGATPTRRVRLDDAALEWPGDYQGLVATRDAYVAAYGREADIVATRSKR